MAAQPNKNNTLSDTKLELVGDSGLSSERLTHDSRGVTFCSKTKNIKFVSFVKAKSQEKKQGRPSNLVYKKLESGDTLMPFPDPKDNNFDAATKIFKSACHKGSDLAGIAVVKTHTNQYAWSVNYTKLASSSTSYNTMHIENSFPDPNSSDFSRARSLFQRYSPHGSVVTKITTTQPKGLPTRWCVLYKVEKKRRTLCSTIRRFVNEMVIRLTKNEPDQMKTIEMENANSNKNPTPLKDLKLTKSSDLTFGVVEKTDRNNTKRVKIDELNSGTQIPRKIYLDGVDITCTLLGRTRFTWGDISRLKSGHSSVLKASNTRRSLLSNVSTYVRTVIQTMKDKNVVVAPVPETVLVDYRNIAAGKMNSAQNIAKVRKYLLISQMEPLYEDVEKWLESKNLCVDFNTHNQAIAEFVMNRIKTCAVRNCDLENYSQYEYAVEISNLGLSCTPELWTIYLASVTRDITKLSELLHVIEAFGILR